MTLHQIVGPDDGSAAFTLVPNPEDANSLSFRRPASADGPGLFVPPFGTADLAEIALRAQHAGWQITGLTLIDQGHFEGAPAAWEARMVTAARNGETGFGLSRECDLSLWFPGVRELHMLRERTPTHVGRMGRYRSATDELFLEVLLPYLEERYEVRTPPRRRLVDRLLRRAI